MITTGIIKEINLSSSSYSCNKYLVELNIFQSPGNLYKNNYTCQANCSTMPGHYDSYEVGDKVYVGFINEDLSIPIILGKIYQGIDNQFRSQINCQNLKVNGTSELSKSTKIGDITYEQLVRLFNVEPEYYYNHIVECSILGYSDLRIKFKFMNRLSTPYANETHSPSFLLQEMYRITGGATIFCDLYKMSADDPSSWTYQTTCLLRLTQESCAANKVYIESSVVQIEESEYEISKILTDSVIRI